MVAGRTEARSTRLTDEKHFPPTPWPELVAIGLPLTIVCRKLLQGSKKHMLFIGFLLVVYLIRLDASYAALAEPFWEGGIDYEADHKHVVYVDHPMERRVLQEGPVLDQSLLEYSNSTVVQPIRIAFITDLLVKQKEASSQFSDEIDNILATLPEAAGTWAQHLNVVPVQDSIFVDTEACSGALGSVPARSVDADLVIIVTARTRLRNGDESHRVCTGRTLAVAVPCTLDQYDRPIVGFINYCLGVEDSELNTFLRDSFSPHLGVDLSRQKPDLIDVTLHEMAHILGFTSWMFKYFRKPDGSPRTPRPFVSQTVTCVNGDQIQSQFPSSQTLELVESDGELYYTVNTPRVRQVVRNQFNCQSMMGARLENRGPCVGSHWHERLFFGEIMSPVLMSGGENMLTPLTLALLEDSGWYSVEYRGSEPSTFGLAAGCNFVQHDCIVDSGVPEWGHGLFCETPMRFVGSKLSSESLNSATCDPSHKAFSLCDLWDKPTVPEEIAVFPAASASDVRYFADENLVPSFPLAQSCPIPTKALGLDCTIDNPNYNGFYRGETTGFNSRCVNAFHNEGANRINRPACLPITCDLEDRKVLVGTGASQQECQEEGQVLFMSSSSTAFFECPRLEAVCPKLFSCPSSCSGRGVCARRGNTAPRCVCREGLGDGCYATTRESVPEKGAEGLDSSTSCCLQMITLLATLATGFAASR